MSNNNKIFQHLVQNKQKLQMKKKKLLTKKLRNSLNNQAIKKINMMMKILTTIYQNQNKGQIKKNNNKITEELANIN